MNPAQLPPAVHGDVGVAIVDDEPLARRGLRDLVRTLTGFQVTGEAGDADEAVALIRRTRPAIVLLDVRLPGSSGFDVMRRLPAGERPLVIFVTAHDEYAIRAFEVHAVDYLLKPFTEARVTAALKSAEARRRADAYLTWGEQLGSLLEGMHDDARRAAVQSSQAELPGRIVVKSVGRTEIVSTADLVWVEACGYYVRLHRQHGAVLHRESLDALTARLNAARFVRVHRSAIVCVAAVRFVRRTRRGGHTVVLVTGAQVPVSRAGWRVLRKLLDVDAGGRAVQREPAS